MIDSTLVVVAPTGAQSASAKSSPAVPSKNGGEDPGFAEFLAQSTERAGAWGQSAEAREHSSAALGHAPKKEGKTKTTRADVANGVDLAALIALVPTDSLPALLPVGGKPSADTPGITPETPSASAASAGATSSGPLVRSTAKAVAINRGDEPGNAFVLAQSTGQAGAWGPSAGARAHSSVSLGHDPDKEGKTEATHADVAKGIDLAAPGALAAAEKLPAIDDPANPSSGVIPASDEPPVSGPRMATVQAAGTDRNAHGAPATDTGSREGPHEGPAAKNASNPVTQQVKLTEIRDGSASQKADEAHLSAAHQLETAPVVNLVTGAAAPAAGAHTLVSAGPAAILLVPTHVESPAWSKDFGQHVIRLAVDGQPAAEIHLNPPDWGPIRVSIEIKGQDATLQFAAEHLQTREALEAALPRLRELFAAGSLSLAGADVTAQSSSQHFSGSPGQRFDQPPAAAGN